jgi:hypothetical protein
MTKIMIALLLSLLMWPVCYLIGTKSAKQQPIDTQAKYFVNGSGEFLSLIKLDLPEEITTVTQTTDSTTDLLSAYLDTATGIIHLGFTGLQIPRGDMQYLNEEPCLVKPFYQQHKCGALMEEYQIRLEMDSLLLFDHGRYVGTAKYGNSQLDSLFMKDNL